ncbi:VWA domain-containing protein [Sediminispirochaeta bajacaliforniensis]|uniref:VWA domain-containing protein n=1 Tax=Sediminispirochaeta bajacaliforniensis TaxID=148 RepID=UPI000380EB70|nr:VWA domain-containing protein [Sediminispirochaeta bajacaliforniensis]
MNRFAAVVCITVFLASAFTLSAETLQITQIDSSSLLLSQSVDLYVSLTDDTGTPLKGISGDSFQLFESDGPDTFSEPMLIRSLAPNPHESQGLSILLLMDNSGSMYDTLSGDPTGDPALMRTTYARNALRTFVGSSFHAGDSVSFATFNTNVVLHADEAGDPVVMDMLLSGIRRPGTDESYTELYHALADMALPVGERSGRRAVIVLSDGEDYSYAAHSGNLHPIYGNQQLSPDEVVEEYIRNGVTLYAIHFGLEKDQYLGEMALKTGGAVYDAKDQEELTGIYHDIRQKIDGEYLIRYRAGMFPTDKTYVKLIHKSPEGNSEAVRYYYTSTMFGQPVVPFPWKIFLILPAVLLIWLLLLLIRNRTFHSDAALRILRAGYGTKISSATIAIQQEKTVIGGGEQADLTLSGRGVPHDRDVTIVFDKQQKNYTIVGGAGVSVNNQPLKGERRLSGGDVLNIEGTTIVFEEPDESKN